MVQYDRTGIGDFDHMAVLWLVGFDGPCQLTMLPWVYTSALMDFNESAHFFAPHRGVLTC